MNERPFISSGRQAPSRGATTRQTILSAAGDHFLRQGDHGTSMRQIAQRAGVTPAAIYNHFPAKESIFAELLLERSPHAAVTAALEGAEGGSASALVLDGLRRMRAALDETGIGFRLLAIELIEFRGDH